MVIWRWVVSLCEWVTLTRYVRLDASLLVVWKLYQQQVPYLNEVKFSCSAEWPVVKILFVKRNSFSSSPDKKLIALKNSWNFFSQNGNPPPPYTHWIWTEFPINQSGQNFVGFTLFFPNFSAIKFPLQAPWSLTGKIPHFTPGKQEIQWTVT